MIGRGPTIASRLARAAPNPVAAAASISVLFAALAAIAMISPSGEQATASRSSVQVAAGATGQLADGRSGVKKAAPAGQAAKGSLSDDRSPFAAHGYRPPPNGKRAATQATNVTGAPATPAPHGRQYMADFIFYSSYAPWERLKRRAGTWLDFNGKPTLKFVSVDATGVNLFIVSDVEVLKDQSRDIRYDYPLRTLHVDNGGIVRLADYRDIQGDDVIYTLRYRKSVPLNGFAG